MANFNNKGIPGLNIDADMTDGIKDMEFLKRFCQEMSTEAHIDTVMTATHSIFADEFDKKMKGVASTSKDNFFHVYEYSPSGNGYSWVGNPDHKLWQHTMRGRGDRKTFSWNWLPAKQFNPSYKQRRMPGPGRDGIRELSYRDYRELLRKSSSRGEGYRFSWKAPILEYNIQRIVYPRRKRLMLPRNGRKIFVTSYAAEQQHPGPTKGRFTAEWINFWTGEVGNRFHEVVGQQIEKDAKRRIEAALAAGKSAPRKENRKFRVMSFADITDAKLAGQQQAVSAIKYHQRTIKGIEANRGRVL